MQLREWTVLHVKHRDAFAKKLQDVAEHDDHIEFQFDDHVLTGYALEQLSLPKIHGKTLIVTLHTKANVEEMLRQWKEFAAHPELTVTFAHPGRNEQWSIKPALHDRVAGDDVEAGIWSMTSGVSHV